MSYLAKVNRTKVPFELLAAKMERHAGMKRERRGVFEARVFELAELLNEKGYSGKRHSDLALAVEFRLTALARLLSGDEVQRWDIAGRGT